MYSVAPLPKDYAKKLADRFVALRKDNGWTQKEMARRSGVSLGSLKRFEQSAQISLIHLLKLTHVLGRLTDFDEVFAWDADLAAARKRINAFNDD